MNKKYLKITISKFGSAVQVQPVEIFSWKKNKEHPFELFKLEFMICNFLLDKSNMDYKEDWAMEYEMIYNSQLMET